MAINFNKALRTNTYLGFKYKYKVFGFNYDNPATLVNENEYRTVLAFSIKDKLSIDEITTILANDKNKRLKYHPGINDSKCLFG